MEIFQFAKALHSDGNVIVENKLNLDIAQSPELDQYLESVYHTDLLELPGKAPSFNSEAAFWGVSTLYKIIQYLLIRDAQTEHMVLGLWPGDLCPSAIYSVDLSLRYLPDVYHLAEGLLPTDPLLEVVDEIANQFPMSSVGIDLLDKKWQYSDLLSDATLSRLYADRIIKEKDKKRLKQNEIQELVERRLGFYPEIGWKEYDSAIEYVRQDDRRDENR